MTTSRSLGSRFRQLWLGVRGRDGLAIYGVLTRFYSQEHRHYHTLAHVGDCLGELDTLRAAQPRLLAPREWQAVELALWFHDVVHEPRARDNEERSADLFEAVALAAAFPPRFIATVRGMILATKQGAPPPDGAGGQVVGDCDLASLGYPPEQFWRSGAAIRREYDFLSEEDFVAVRRVIFLRLSERPSIFQTEFMRDRYEAQARANLAEGLRGLP